MERLYFTFGSNPEHPYQRGQYIMVIGNTMKDCTNTFKKKYPNKAGSDSLNCADYYTEKNWKNIEKEYYKGKAPEEILVSDTVYGKKPEGFDPIWFYIPDALIYLQEGSGDNLTKEDRKAGYNDYLEYTIYSIEYGEVEEEDGGQLMLPYMVREHYQCLADAIPDILVFQYGEAFMNVKILKKDYMYD